MARSFVAELKILEDYGELGKTIMKKIIDNAENLVTQMIDGMLKAHPNLLSADLKYKIVKRKSLNPDKVSLISGGGSGHEPAHAGFVGTGMLDAAVCGDVFASPSTIQVYNAIVATKSNKGTLLIVKNYTGDVMNFDAAASMAEDDGIKVAKVYVNDDVAVQDSLYTTGRRGVAGTILVHKIAGAAAECGKSLEEVKAVAEKVIAQVRSLGFALSSCTVPAKGSPTFTLEDDRMEFGVGIHGEQGISREAVLPATQLAEKLVDKILAEQIYKPGDEIALMINGLGGSPLQELYLLNSAVTRETQTKGLKVYKTFVGNYMTSLEMTGASVTLLKLDEELKALLGAKACTPALFICRHHR